VPSGTDLYDPQIIYDRNALRFVLTVLGTNTSNGNQDSYLFVAASTPGQSPLAGTWNSWRINVNRKPDGTLNSKLRWADRDHLGANTDGVYVTANMYAFPYGRTNAGPFQYAKLWVIPDANINGFASSLHASEHSPLREANGGHAFSVVPGNTLGTDGKEYMVSWQDFTRSPGRETFSFFTVVCCSAKPTATIAVSVDGSFFPSKTDAGNGGGSNPALKIRFGDSQQYLPSQATVVGGNLWTTETIESPSEPGHSAIGLFSLSPQSSWGGYSLVSGNWCYNSSVAVEGSNAQVIVFNLSNNSTPPRIGWRSREGGFWSGQSSYLVGGVPSTATGGGWGDYAGAAADPDGATAWLFNEYVPNSFVEWGTYIAGVR
jgi:hypothetical protein